MSLERKPSGRPNPEAAPARTLKPAVNPAQRLQELLRREAQQAREASPPPAPVEEPAAPALPPFLNNLAPLPLPDPEPLAEPDPQAALEPPAAAPPVVADPVAEGQEPVTLVVLVNSERSTPVEYASAAAMPTGEELQETHQAYLLSDEWNRRGAALVRTVRLRRRRR